MTRYSAEVEAFWENYRRRSGLPEGTRWAAWSFGDNPGLADGLLALVLTGEKRGTADLLKEFEHNGEPVPRVSNYSVVLDGSGRLRVVIRTSCVDVRPFPKVDTGFAYSEGEDDRTLESWRREHRKYFRRVLAARGEEFDESSLVVMESFELVYP